MAVRNSFTGIGSAGTEPTHRSVGDKEVVSIRLAINNGREREPLWLTVEGWGRIGERLAAVAKGDRIGIAGRLEVSEWEAKDGAKRTTVKVILDDLMMLSAKAAAGESAASAEDSEDDPF